jgi:GTP cyclohydrolase I
MKILTHQETRILASKLASAIGNDPVIAYCIPRGGIPVGYLVSTFLPNLSITDDPEHATIFIDDIIDSGNTMEKYCDDYPGRVFYALIDKTNKSSPYANDWICFPWENAARSKDDSIVGTITNRIKESHAPFHANDNISAFVSPDELPALQAELSKRASHFLRGLVIDIDNDHNTKGTADRIAKMYLQEVFKGRYLPAPKVTDFPNAKGLDEVYTIGPITIRSACSHHFVPIIGRCWIGIIPGDRVIGISKFNRIVDWIASRPQIQEEMAMQIANYIEEQIQPKGLAVIIEATHMCMTWRGVKEPMESMMKNSIMRGVFRDKPEARAEFMALVSK